MDDFQHCGFTNTGSSDECVSTDFHEGIHVQVDLACKILDGGPFRDDPDKVISVQPAKFEMHGDTYVPKKKKQKKKKKIVKEDKVLGWGGFDDMLPPTQVRGRINF